MANRYNCDVPRVLVTGSVGFLGLRLCERPCEGRQRSRVWSTGHSVRKQASMIITQ